MVKTKNKNTEDQLLDRLSNAGWSIVAKDDDTSWWVDEHWTIRSTSQNYGFELVVNFLVDPMYEGKDKAANVWLVTATSSKPKDRRQAESAPAGMVLSRGKIPENIVKFIEQLDGIRNACEGEVN